MAATTARTERLTRAQPSAACQGMPVRTAHLGGAGRSVRHPRRPVQRRVQAGHVDQEEPEEVLLGFQERPVGEQPFPAADPEAGRGVRLGELLGAEQDAGLLHRFGVIDPRLSDRGVRILAGGRGE